MTHATKTGSVPLPSMSMNVMLNIILSMSNFWLPGLTVTSLIMKSVVFILLHIFYIHYRLLTTGMVWMDDLFFHAKLWEHLVFICQFTQCAETLDDPYHKRFLLPKIIGYQNLDQEAGFDNMVYMSHWHKTLLRNSVLLSRNLAWSTDSANNTTLQ